MVVLASLNPDSKRIATVMSFSLGLLTSSFGVWASKNSAFTADSLPVVSPIFVIGVCILSISYALELKGLARGRWLGGILATAFCLLEIFPFAVEGRPHFAFQYLNYGYTESILRTGKIDSTQLPYLNWPGSQAYGACFALVTGLRDESFVTVAQAISGLLALAGTIFVSRRMFGRSKAFWLSVWLGSVVFIATPFFLAANLALVIGVFLIGILMDQTNRSRFGALRQSGLAVVLVSTLVITHLLTALVVGIYVILLALMLSFLGSKRRLTLAVFTVCLVAGYQLFVAEAWTLSAIVPFLQSWINFDETVSQTYRLGFSGSTSHSLIVLLRISYAALVSALAIPTLVRFLRSRLQTGESQHMVGWLGASLAPSVSVPYGGEILSRAFASGIPVLLLCIAAASKKLVPLVMSVLVVSPAVSIALAYGNLPTDYVSSNEPAASRLLSALAPDATVCSLRLRLWLMHDIDSRSWRPMSVGPSQPVSCGPGSPLIAFSDRDVADYQYIVGAVDVDAIQSYLASRSQVYDAGGIRLYS